MLDKDLNPPEYDPEYTPLFCHECGEPLYYNDTIFNDGDVIYCEDCGNEIFRRTVTDEDLAKAEEDKRDREEVKKIEWDSGYDEWW